MHKHHPIFILRRTKRIDHFCSWVSRTIALTIFNGPKWGLCYRIIFKNTQMAQRTITQDRLDWVLPIRRTPNRNPPFWHLLPRKKIGSWHFSFSAFTVRIRFNLLPKLVFFSRGFFLSPTLNLAFRHQRDKTYHSKYDPFQACRSNNNLPVPAAMLLCSFR